MSLVRHVASDLAIALMSSPHLLRRWLAMFVLCNLHVLSASLYVLYP